MKMKKIYFENLSASPNSIELKWQRDIINQIDKEYADQAVEVSEKFRKLALESLTTSREGYAATGIDDAMRKIERYCFVKHVEGSGKKYDVQIDLLLHTVLFIEI